MALDLSARYPGQVATSDPAGYPYGMAQNVTVEGDGTGTPLEKDLVNDIYGALQALLVAAGITPSGFPDKANASQYLTAIRWIAEGARATFDVKDPRFGATGLGVLDDTAAIQAALTAAGLVRGRVYFPDGTYRVIAALTIPVGVDLFGGGVAKFLKDHATSDIFVWATGAGTGCGVTIENLRFEGAQVNTGRVWFGQGSATVIVTFIRCSVNVADNKLRGQLGRFDDAGSKVAMLDCICNMMDTASSGFTGAGTIVMRGGEYSVPGGYANNFSTFSTGRYFGVKFTQLLSTVGDFAFIFATDAIVKGCRFRVTDSGAPALTYALAIAPGSVVVSSGNDFGTDAGGYCFPCKGTGAARGSVIQLLPAARQSVAGGTLVLQSHYESVGVKYTVSAPTFQLPDPKVEGQKLHVTFFNVSGGPLGFGVGNYGYKASQPTPSHNSGASATFIASDPADTGTLVWSQVGDWASIAA